MYQPLTLENDRTVLNFMNDRNTRNDALFRDTLQLFMSKIALSLACYRDSIKSFLRMVVPKVCFYGINSDPNPDIDVFPIFSCGSTDLNTEKPKVVLKHLMAELKLHQDVTPLNNTN